MTEPVRPPAERLTRALDVWLQHRAAPRCSDAELVAHHADLRDLLAPMLEPDPESSAAMAATPAHEPPDFGDYRLLRELGRGGVGVVHEAIQIPLGRRVALKVLAGALVHQPHAVARFRRESELLARLQHPHIVPVFDAGVVDGVPFHAMELIDGCGLHEVLRRLHGSTLVQRDGAALSKALAAALADPDAGAKLVGKSHVAATLWLVGAVAAGLECAHRAGILHRDVKPANILLRRDGVPLLGDFGLARDCADPGLTRPGEFAGTPYYISPEQADGLVDRVDPRSDVFSLAVVLYEVLLGERPFEGDTSEEVLAKVRTAEPPALRGRAQGLPLDLAAVLDKALQKRPQDRYASVAEFAAELRCVAELRPVRARRRGPLGRSLQALRRRPTQSALVLALALSVLAAAAAYTYLRVQQPRITSATLAERLPQVERHLEMTMMELEDGDDGRAATHVAAAALLLPDLAEVLVAQLLLHRRQQDLESGAPYLQRLRVVAPDVAVQLEAATPPEPVTGLGWFVRGVRHLQDGIYANDPSEYLLAAEALRRAIHRASRPRSLFHCQYLQALMLVRDGDELRRVAADALHLWPDSPFVAYWRGFSLQSHEPEVAKQELHRALQAVPELPQVYLRLAKCYENERDYAEAEQLLRRALMIAPHDGNARLPLARVLLQLARPTEALAEVDRARQLGASAWREAMIRARVLVRLDRLDEALAAANAAVLHAPLAAEPLRVRALVREQRDEGDEALRDIERACVMDPRNTDCLESKASLLLGMSRWEDAADVFERILAHKPRDKGACCDLASMRRRLGDLDAAERALQRAEAIDPNFWLLHLQRAHLRRAQGRTAEAEQGFAAAASANLRDAESRINLAGFRFAAKQHEEGLELLRAAYRLRPDLPQASTPLVARLEAMGSYQEAEAVLAEVCERSREGRRWAQLARLRRMLDGAERERCAATLARAIELAGDQVPEILEERAEQLLLDGDRDAARALLQQVVDRPEVSAFLRNRCQRRLHELTP